MTIQVRSDINNEPFVLDDTAEVLDGITLAANQGALTIGAVLGEVTATPGTYSLCDSGGTNGSQLPKLILATADVADSSGAITELSAYSRGLFDENQLVFSDGTDIDSRLPLTTLSDGSTLTDITMRGALRMFNIRVAPGISVSKYQNPVI